MSFEQKTQHLLMMYLQMNYSIQLLINIPSQPLNQTLTRRINSFLTSSSSMETLVKT